MLKYVKLWKLYSSYILILHSYILLPRYLWVLFLTNWPACFPHKSKHTDGESWNPTNQSWKGGQNPLTQLNQLQHESLNLSMDTPGEVIRELLRPLLPSLGRNNLQKHPRSLVEYPYQIQMLFPKAMEEDLLRIRVSLTPDWNIPGSSPKPLGHGFQSLHLSKCSSLNFFYCICSLLQSWCSALSFFFLLSK